MPRAAAAAPSCDESVAVHEGEVVGIAGVEGNGQAELVDAIMGLRPLAAGSMRLGDDDITALDHPRAAGRRASGSSPRTGTVRACCWRRRSGRTGSSGIRRGRPRRKGWFIDRKAARADTERIMKRLRRPRARARHAGRRAVRRQPAEAHRRPRDERRAAAADRRAPDPRRRRRRPGRDLGAAQGRPRRRAGRSC